MYTFNSIVSRKEKERMEKENIDAYKDSNSL